MQLLQNCMYNMCCIKSGILSFCLWYVPPEKAQLAVCFLCYVKSIDIIKKVPKESHSHSFKEHFSLVRLVHPLNFIITCKVAENRLH